MKMDDAHLGALSSRLPRPGVPWGVPWEQPTRGGELGEE
jgi:hypothetical protein